MSWSWRGPATVAGALLVIVALVVATMGGRDAAQGLEDAEVFFTHPLDATSVASPVALRLEATGVAIEPAGEVRPGTGHFHVMVDVACVPSGSAVPRDASHHHLGGGETTLELELEPGEHTLCLQLGDGAHAAHDVTDVITFQVR